MLKEEWILTGEALLDDGTKVAFEARYREPSPCWDRLKEIGNEGLLKMDEQGGRSGTFIPAHRIKELVYDISKIQGE